MAFVEDQVELQHLALDALVKFCRGRKRWAENKRGNTQVVRHGDHYLLG
jgi:hypothetical protein